MGKLILIFGPSGSGKGILVAHVRATFPQLIFPTSWTTRPPRPGEESGESQSGKKYRFVSKNEFTKHAAEEGFLEWAEYSGHYYGTPKDEVEEAIQRGHTVLQELEIQGIRQLREHFSGSLVTIFIDAGSWDELKRRILLRAPMTPEELEARRRRYEQEIAFKHEANYVVENREGRLEEAKRALVDTIQSILKDNLSS
ncbi:hypothetical protein A3D66_02820 [Candidatus Kaiserbacteria bacterium RIFCSPHIGHO2_02_FULL_50_9]|uniref:Guanylate kinase n=1 Tax=Candidatus Kaiserbacteria bacterium RIFCSPLOWO2_01_FULL_51_21 TaxID=1798508 RepID=A0A1F6ECI3_9BACT|nr:MAG: hypothetical protein A2761_01200 [Candidatus Kaiserbacteria bacterium RIFCSPHIGHO2_01_FULL_51_33]OGG63349.1 MAG: hypothetical protein A3D66_02820 [Candidatus Kaiserbacteria bacterium RIFCSPHIGHO2_02_FULL_50_9]OGG71378.1 MAG: hypothetical protein A3A35_01355 [Candidatus Kaiserbacteria bacterium RIFCSPLOWO2_01_FULL_51_21]